MASHRARNFRSRASFDVSYRGIPIFAVPGLHELAAERLSAVLAPSKHADVLELGTGGGAMALRLSDGGFRVTASDLSVGGFVPANEVPFVELDLNGYFAARLNARFDALVALEVIEHLENPYHFFRECAQLLANAGYLVVSTPNLANPVSQAMFVLQGDFQWFGEADYREQGHITPLTPRMLRCNWREAGFECCWEGSVGDPSRMLVMFEGRSTRWLARFLAALSGTPAQHRGEVYIAVLQKVR